MCFFWYCSPHSCFGHLVCFGKALCSLIEMKTSTAPWKQEKQLLSGCLSLASLDSLSVLCSNDQWVCVCACSGQPGTFLSVVMSGLPRYRLRLGLSTATRMLPPPQPPSRPAPGLNTAALMFDFVFVCVRASRCFFKCPSCVAVGVTVITAKDSTVGRRRGRQEMFLLNYKRLAPCNRSLSLL